jgi:hypothetical protein
MDGGYLRLCARLLRRSFRLRAAHRDPSLLASQEGIDCRLAGGQGLGFRFVVPSPNSDGQWLATMKDLPNPLIGPFAAAHRDQMKFVLCRTRHFFGDAMFDGPYNRPRQLAGQGLPAPTGSCRLVTTLQGIAAELNKQGIPTASGRGDWQAVQVARVLGRL